MTERKRSRSPVRRDERDAFLVMLSDRLRDLVDPRAVMALACELLGEHLGANRVLYGKVEGARWVVQDHYYRGVPNVAGTYRLEELGPSMVDEANAGRDVVVVDVTIDPRLVREQAHYEAIQTRAGIGIPLVRDGLLKAVLAVHQREPRQWSADEVALVRAVAERTWAAVEHVNTEAALRASEERFRLAIEGTGMGIFVWYADSDHLEANARLFELCDISRESASSISAVLRERIHPDDRARFDEQWAGAIDPSGTGAFRDEFRLVRADGEVRWIVFAGQVHFAGEPRRAVRSGGTAQDVTERKRAEAVLAAAARRDAFRVALSDALRPLADPNEIRRAACRVLSDHLGANRTFYAEIDAAGKRALVEEDVAKGVPSLAGWHRLEDFAGVLSPLCEGRVLVLNDVSTDTRVDPKSLPAYGGLHAAASIAVPLIKDGRFAACLVVSQFAPRAWAGEEVALVEETADRTWSAVEHAKVAHDLREAAQELREAAHRKDEFLAILAHELRNPLAPLRNSLEIMRLAPNDSQSMERAREIMTRQLAQMVHLIDDLLDVSRISRGKVVLRREQAALGPIVQQAIETNLPLIESTSQRLTIEIPAEPILVDADPTRLAQVFANLLNNAAKYSEQGGEVALAVEREGAWAVVRVRDTGVGIPPEMLSRVFDMFLQVDRSLEKAQGGLGVGLSLVKGLVELHGGTVEARSKGLGQGSEFVVRLPIVSARPARPAHPAHRRPAVAPARRRVLVVDDNRDAATSLAVVLDALNYETRTAFDGADAIRAAADFRPAVVLLDIGMPRLNGYEVCRRMRQKPWGRNIHIGALTGWGRDLDQERSKPAGFDFYLVKPVDPHALSRLLTSLPTSPTAEQTQSEVRTTGR